MALQITAASNYGYSLTYQATGLPPGLGITTTGMILGRPRFGADPPTTYTVTVTVTDSHGTQGSATFTWSVQWNRLQADHLLVEQPAGNATPAGIRAGQPLKS